MIVMPIIPDGMLPSRELPPTFTIQLEHFPGRYEGTISNYTPFNAQLHYTDMHRTDEIAHTPDKHTYAFLLWPDSYIEITYQGKRYLLDVQAAEEEIQAHG